MRIIKKMDREELLKYIKEFSSSDFSGHTTEQLVIEKFKIQMRDAKVKRGRPRKIKDQD